MKTVALYLAAAVFAIVVFGNLLGNAIESFSLVASWFGL